MTEGRDGDELVSEASGAYLKILEGMTVEQAQVVLLSRILANAELHGRMLEEIANYAERQTELLERIAAALRPEITETKIDPHAPAHERGV